MTIERVSWVVYVKAAGLSAPIVSYHYGTRVAYETARARLPVELDAMLAPADRPMGPTLAFGFVDLTGPEPAIEYDADKVEAESPDTAIVQQLMNGTDPLPRTRPSQDAGAWRYLPVAPRRKLTRRIVL